MRRRSFASLALVTAAACGGDPDATSTLNTPTTPTKVSPVMTDAAAQEPHGNPALPYPATRRDDAIAEMHFGIPVKDPYRWLEDAKSPEVQAWTHAQGDFARGYLDKLPGRDGFVQRLKELMYVPAIGVPVKHGNSLFYVRRDPKKEKAVLCVRELHEVHDAAVKAHGDLYGLAGLPEKGERVLLDPNTWSTDGSSSLGVWSPSWDGTKLAYSVKKNNSDEAVLEVIEVASGKKLAADEIVGAKYANPQWTPAGDGFYYTFLPLVDVAGETLKPSERPGYAEIRFHKLGTSPKDDARIYPKTDDPKTFLATQISEDGHWLRVDVQHGWTRVDVFAKDLRKPNSDFVTIVSGTDAQYDITVYKDHFYTETNDGAPNGRIVVIDPKNPQKANWTEIIAERPDSSISSFSLVAGKLCVTYLKDVVSQLEIHSLDGKKEHDVPLEVGAISGVSGLPGDPQGFFSFASFTHPSEILSLRPATGTTSSIFQVQVPLDPTKFAVDQVFSTSKDGTRIPMFVVHKKGLAQDGTANAILYGYGGFQVAQLPAFQASMIPWLEGGGVYAIANLRGGDEYGEKWHRGGMLHEKQHVFDDAIASAETLLANKWTSKGKLAVRGGSNGGLLVGTLLTQRPDLFDVALCAVPLLDMIRYTEFGSGKTWIDEYGTPEKEEDFAVLYSYSPYHHVKRGVHYPATLLLSSDSDDRVDPMHARKFAAELQDASTGGPVLLRIEKNAGHGGADLIKSTIDRIADEYSFALANLRK